MANSSPDLPKPLRGITLDSIENLNQSLNLIKSSSQKLTASPPPAPAQRGAPGAGRGRGPGRESLDNYGKAVEALHPHAYVMVQVVDSQEMAQKSVADVRSRAAQAMAKFGDKVDLWEVGNELNGDWAGSSPGEINAKAQAAYDAISSKGGRTAITLNYWSGSDCYQNSWEATLPYAQAMPAKLKNVDYLFLSVYETACDPHQRPSSSDLSQTLGKLGEIFPKAQLGIGEVGAQDTSDGLSDTPNKSEKERIANYYYGMHSDLAQKVGGRYTGGYFWWYFHRDAVQPLQARPGPRVRRRPLMACGGPLSARRPSHYPGESVHRRAVVHTGAMTIKRAMNPSKREGARARMPR